jgi:hypothetical protein
MRSEFKSHKSYQQFAYSVRRCWRYMRTTEVNDFIEAVLATSSGKSQEVEAGQLVWRAQVGYNLRKSDDIEAPFSCERMKPPADWLIEGRAPEGRINPAGIPFLYVATRMETAIGEVRPTLGSLISVVQLRTNRHLRLINCTTDDVKIPTIIHFAEPNGEERTLAVWRDIDRAFSQPVTDFGERADYAATQFLAEVFRHNGFDGIAYRSSFGPGHGSSVLSNPLISAHNIALFDLNAADVAAAPQLVAVTNLSFEYSRR